MGFLQKFFNNVIHESEQKRRLSSFESLADEDLQAHLNIFKYDNFLLTDAVRPSYDVQVKPCQAYRHDTYLDEETSSQVPVLMASASRTVLFDLFVQLIRPLGQTVDVVLETSHGHMEQGHDDLYREQIDMPVLVSILYEFEDLLLNDGCTGIAVLNPNIPQEVQFDEHKLLIVYGSPLEHYEHILESTDVPCDDQLKFITEAEHVHSSSERYQKQFEQLKARLGMDVAFS
jgi:hypothetical protein